MNYIVERDHWEEEKFEKLLDYLSDAEIDDFDRVVWINHSGNNLCERILEEDTFNSNTIHENGDEFSETINLGQENTLYVLVFGALSSEPTSTPDANPITVYDETYELDVAESDHYPDESTDERNAFLTVEDEKGNRLGFLAENYFVIQADITHESNNDNSELPVEVFKYMLEAHQTREVPNLEEAKRENFIEELRDAQKNKVSELEDERDTLENRYEDQLEDVISTGREIQELENLISNYKSDEVNLEEMFESIEQNSKVREVRLGGDHIKVITESLTLEGNEIGNYEIQLGIEGSISVFHKPKLSGHQHPHVTSGGNPCLGNMSSVVDNLKHFEYDVAAEIMINFVQEYSEAGGPYIKLDEWLDAYREELP